METNKIVSGISWFAEKLGTFLQAARMTTSVVAAGVRISDEVGAIGLTLANDKEDKGVRGAELLASASFITLDVLRIADNVGEAQEWRKKRSDTEPFYKQFEPEARESLKQRGWRSPSSYSVKRDAKELATDANCANTPPFFKARLGLAAFGTTMRFFAYKKEQGPRLGGPAPSAWIHSAPMPLLIELCELIQAGVRSEQSNDPNYDASKDRRWLQLNPGQTVNSVIIALNLGDIAFRCTHHEIGRLIRLYPERREERRQEQITQIAGSPIQAMAALDSRSEQIDRIRGLLERGEILSQQDERALRSLVGLTGY